MVSEGQGWRLARQGPGFSCGIHKKKNEPCASAARRPAAVFDMSTELPQPMTSDSCVRLLQEVPKLAVLLEPVRLIFCPNAKAGTTTVNTLLRTLLDSRSLGPQRRRPIVASSHVVRAGQSESLANHTEHGRMNVSRARAFCRCWNSPLPHLIRHFLSAEFAFASVAQKRRGILFHHRSKSVVSGARSLPAPCLCLCQTWLHRHHLIATMNHSQVISAYVGKVADDNQTHAPHHSLARMRTWYGLGSTASISFSQFVRWIGLDKTDDNAHWRPHSRQCVPNSHPYSFVARAETLEADLRMLTRRVGLSESLVVAEHISSASKCRMSARCAAALNWQVGPDWATLRSEEVLARMYRSDPAHDLRSAVRRAFAADVKAQNYTFPSPKKNVGIINMA